MLITYTIYVVCVCVCVCVCVWVCVCVCVCVCVSPEEGIVAVNATPNPFHLNKICLNQCLSVQIAPLNSERNTLLSN